MCPPISNPKSFRNEAQWQRVCAVCKKAGPFHAHHVVDKAILKNRCGLRGVKLYDTRNSLRLCQALGDVRYRCHFQHENRMRVVKTTELTDENLEYAFEALGEYAADYLRSEYDDTERDERICNLELKLAA